MTDVDQADHQREVAVLVEIALDQLRPAALLGFRHACVAVAGQVDETGAFGCEEVDGGRLAGLLRDLRQAFAAEQGVEHGRLAHVRTAGERHFRKRRGRQLRRDAERALEGYVVEVHMVLQMVRSCACTMIACFGLRICPRHPPSAITPHDGKRGFREKSCHRLTICHLSHTLSNGVKVIGVEHRLTYGDGQRKKGRRT